MVKEGVDEGRRGKKRVTRKAKKVKYSILQSV